MQARRNWFIVALAVLLSTLAMDPAAIAQEFRVESSVFVGKEADPRSESLTLFKGGVVYDFALPEAEETTIFDSPHARFVVLDHKRRMKTVVSTTELLAFEQNLRAEPKATKQEFLFDPKFEEQFDDQTRWLTLKGDQITYRAKLLESTPQDDKVVQSYRHFADWYARFNAAYTGNLHTLPRVELNKALANRKAVPAEVELTIAPRGLVSKKLEVRSRHLYNWKLSETDGKRIEKAHAAWADYQDVKLKEFQDGARVAKSK